MTRHLHVQCSAGVAGDMLLGALVDAGADRAAIAAAWASLPVDGYSVTFERVQRCGIGATWANVVISTEHGDGPHDHHHHHDDDPHDHHRADEHAHDHDHPGGRQPEQRAHDHHPGTYGSGHDPAQPGRGHPHEHHPDQHGEHEPRGGEDHHHGGGGTLRHGEPHPHRTLRHLEAMLAGADGLDRAVAETAGRVFRSLCEVEGEIHGLPPEDVELHEVGAVDAIVDIVGVAAAIASLGIDTVSASPVAVGHGTVRAAHGTLPNPAPAVAALLARHQVPIMGVDTDLELSTPTGVAILTELASSFGAPPAMAVQAVGYGAGTADPLGRPNVVQVLVGERSSGPADGAEVGTTAAAGGSTAVVIEANVDDVTGEVLAHTIAAALDAGAFDAWATPIVMKKGRPAHVISVLCDEARAGALGALLVAETGTLGFRSFPVRRSPQHRIESTVHVDGHPVRVKLSDGRAKVEHDDARAVAQATGRPLRDVLRLAEAAADRG